MGMWTHRSRGDERVWAAWGRPARLPVVAAGLLATATLAACSSASGSTGGLPEYTAGQAPARPSSAPGASASRPATTSSALTSSPPSTVTPKADTQAVGDLLTAYLAYDDAVSRGVAPSRTALAQWLVEPELSAVFTRESQLSSSGSKVVGAPSAWTALETKTDGDAGSIITCMTNQGSSTVSASGATSPAAGSVRTTYTLTRTPAGWRISGEQSGGAC